MSDAAYNYRLPKRRKNEFFEYYRDDFEIVIPRSLERERPSSEFVQERIFRELQREDILSDAPNTDEKATWVRIGYVIILGLAIALIGVTLRFVFSGPLPFALATLGMAFVSIALWQGGRMQWELSG